MARTKDLYISKDPTPPASCSSKRDEKKYGNLVAKQMRANSSLITNVLFNADKGYYNKKSISPIFDAFYCQLSRCYKNS